MSKPALVATKNLRGVAICLVRQAGCRCRHPDHLWQPNHMGRKPRRTGTRRSVLTTAGPEATRGCCSDGSCPQCTTQQLSLAIEMPLPGPRLVSGAGYGTDLPGNAGRVPCRPHAELGAVFAQVLEFHEAFNLPREPLPTGHVGDTLAQLRVRLLREEVEEFADATEQRDLVAIADALADVVYVAYGSAVTYGIDLDAVVREVHRANMSKLDAAGRPVLRGDGKVLKSARYTPPNVEKVIDGQLPLFDAAGPAPGHHRAGATVAAG